MNVMAIENNKQTEGSTSSIGQPADQAAPGSNSNGIVTVNNERNPTPEQRDAIISSEPDTERLRSERQSVEQGQGSAS